MLFLFKVENSKVSISVFSITFDQFNASLLNKIISFFKNKKS